MAGGLNNLANLPLKTDGNGYLLVTIGGGNWTPDKITLDSANLDIVLWRQAAKTLQLDSDGASAALTKIILRLNQLDVGSVNGADLLLSGAGTLTFNTRTQFSTPGTAQCVLTNIGATAGIGLDVATDGTLKLRGRALAAGTGNLDVGAKVTAYNNIATAGQGIPSIYGEAISAVLTTGATILTVAPATTTAGRYRVQGNLTTTSGTNTGTVQLTVDYKDSQGTVHTADIMPVINAAGAIAVTGTAASKEFHAIPWEISVDNTTTNIVVKSVVTGSVNYTAQASVEQIG